MAFASLGYRPALVALLVTASGGCRASDGPAKHRKGSRLMDGGAAMKGPGRRAGPRVRSRRVARPRARTVAAAQAPVFRGSLARLGAVLGPGPRARELRARYAHRLVREAEVSAVSDGPRVFIVSGRGLVVAARVADGRILWSQSTRAGVGVPPGLGQGRLFFGDRGGRLWSLSAKTGAVQWKRRVGRAVSAAPLPVGDLVVVGTQSGRLVALDAARGRVRWERRGRRHVLGIASSPDGRVVATSSLDRRVRLLDGRTGQQRWEAVLTSSSRVVPVITDDAVYVLCASGELLKLSRQTGKPLWRHANLGFRSLAPAVASGRVYVASSKRLLYALDEQTGRGVWVKPLSHRPSAPPVFARDSLFVVTRAPALLGVRADNGGHYMRHTLPSQARAEPLVLGAAVLIVDRRGIATLYTKK